jgi:hypothetical protein
MSEHAEHIARVLAGLPEPSDAEVAFLRKALGPAVAAVNAREDAQRAQAKTTVRRAA